MWTNFSIHLDTLFIMKNSCTCYQGTYKWFMGPSWSWSCSSWIYRYLCNQCLSPWKLWVQTVHGEVYLIQWFSLGILVSSTNITEILLKVALNTKTLTSWLIWNLRICCRIIFETSNICCLRVMPLYYVKNDILWLLGIYSSCTDIFDLEGRRDRDHMVVNLI